MRAACVRDLSVSWNGHPLVGPVSFELPTGGVLGLRGPSGAGKSTILRALIRLLPAELHIKGQVQVLGMDVFCEQVDLPALRSKACLVGQTPVVFPGSILANAAFGLRHLVHGSRKQTRKRAEAALIEAALWDEVKDRLDAPADQLSVGQKQRLCLARTLALDPELLLLDEPTSALDRNSAAAVEAAVMGLKGRRGVLIVSHDEAQLARLCDEVLSLEGCCTSQGKSLQLSSAVSLHSNDAGPRH
jgi:phosphate transport system ATP-binding protein